MKKIQVGDKVYLVMPKLRYKDAEQKPIEATVISVGRKYFTVEFPYNHHKFYIDGKTSVTDTNYAIRWYRSLQEIQDEAEYNELTQLLYSQVSRFYGRVGNLEQLREVCEILEIKK